MQQMTGLGVQLVSILDRRVSVWAMMLPLLCCACCNQGVWRDAAALFQDS